MIERNKIIIIMISSNGRLLLKERSFSLTEIQSLVSEEPLLTFFKQIFKNSNNAFSATHLMLIVLTE